MVTCTIITTAKVFLQDCSSVTSLIKPFPNTGESLPWAPTVLLLLGRFSRVWLCVTPETAAHQAPSSLGFSRQEHWSGLPFPSPMHESEKWKWSHSVVSNSWRPRGLQPTRLLRPWGFPGKSTGVGCHGLLWLRNTRWWLIRRLCFLICVFMTSKVLTMWPTTRTPGENWEVWDL